MVGALFALAAYGLALVWGVMNVKNLAQGDFVIAGGYVSWWLVAARFPGAARCSGCFRSDVGHRLGDLQTGDFTCHRA